MTQLRFSGATEFANFTVVNRSDTKFRIEFRLANTSPSSNLQNRIMRNPTTLNDYVEVRWRNTGDIVIYRIDATNYQLSHGLNITGDNLLHDYVLTYDGANLSATIDENSLGSVSASGLTFKDFGRFNGMQDLEYFRYYDSDVGGTLIYNWDANQSNTGPGAVILTETVSGNNAIGSGFPTDGSAWIGASSQITADLTESYDDFIESINVDFNIPILITESYDNFEESISLDFNVPLSITENYDDFSESISVDFTSALPVSITERYENFVENINISFGGKVNFNPKNIIRVKRQQNKIKVKKQINKIRFK